MDQIALGMAIRSIREKQNMSAKELSLAAGLPDYTVSRIENGNMRLEFATAAKITSALGVGMDALAAMAIKLTPKDVIVQREKLQEIRAQLKALRMEMLELANAS